MRGAWCIYGEPIRPWMILLIPPVILLIPAWLLGGLALKIVRRFRPSLLE